MQISVVIPAYNRAHVIGETIDAIIAQSRPVDEIIVVDDGSVDNTVEFLGERYGAKVRILQRQNGGVEAARDQGIRAARHRWVAICDSDDIWLPTHIEQLCLLHEKFPDCGFLFSNFEEFGPTAVNANKFASAPEGFWQAAESSDGDLIKLGSGKMPLLLRFNPVFPSASIFRGDLYAEIGGNNLAIARKLAADADLTRRFAIATGLAANNCVTVQVRKDGNNFSSNSTAVDLARIEILKQNILDGGVFEPYKADIDDSIIETAIRVMIGAFAHRDMKSFEAAAAHVPSRRMDRALRAKKVIAALPRPLRSVIFAFYGLSSRENR